MASLALKQLHEREQAFFDAQAAQSAIEHLDRRILRRYLSPGTLFSREFMFRLLGDLGGKTLLDVGCGEGQDAVLLTRVGAEVTGIDLSPGAIRAARERMRRNQCLGEFIVSPVEDLSDACQYDIVWVEALLHHVLHDLDSVLASLVRHVRPGGMIILSEPVNLFPALRHLRLRFGPPTEATPDERPLEQEHIDTIRKHLPQVQIRYFRLLGRLNRLLLQGNYEHAPFIVRLAVRLLATADRLLLSIPGVSRTASVAVMWARL